VKKTSFRPAAVSGSMPLLYGAGVLVVVSAGVEAGVAAGVAVSAGLLVAGVAEGVAGAEVVLGVLPVAPPPGRRSAAADILVWSPPMAGSIAGATATGESTAGSKLLGFSGGFLSHPTTARHSAANNTITSLFIAAPANGPDAQGGPRTY
jgi:hypothetical protein